MHMYKFLCTYFFKWFYFYGITFATHRYKQSNNKIASYNYATNVQIGILQSRVYRFQ